MNKEDRLRATLRCVAMFEALKGLAALGGITGLLSLLHHDLHHLASELIGHFGLDPHQHYPALLLDAVDKLNATPVSTLVLVATLYIGTRWVEAWGLWHDRGWGEWFGALAGALYVPFEVRHMLHEPGWPGITVLVFNLALVAVLLRRLQQRRQGASAQGCKCRVI